jgi:hypothetical protein
MQRELPTALSDGVVGVTGDRSTGSLSTPFNPR